MLIVPRFTIYTGDQWEKIVAASGHLDVKNCTKQRSLSRVQIGKFLAQVSCVGKLEPDILRQLVNTFTLHKFIVQKVVINCVYYYRLSFVHVVENI